MCSPKDQGGLGIHDLEVKNTALLGQWLFKLLTEEVTWQTILKEDILAKKHYLRFFGNWVSRIFGLGLWKRRSFSLVWALFLLRVVWR
jgi:hypothetical protein